MNSPRFLLRHLAFALILSSVALAQGVLTTLAAAQDVITNWTINRPVVNMYSAPTADSDVVSQAIFGTEVRITEMKDGWAHIKTPDDYTGWVESNTVMSPANGKHYATGSNVVQVRSLFAHIYREQDVTKHAPLLTVPFETRLEVAALPDPSKPGRWLTVLLPDGRKGMLQAADVQIAGPPLSIDDTIALSRKFLGLPYTWGGTSSYGYDCSGFTQMLVRQRGKVMPRDADIQAAWSGLSSVERAQLQPGDLLFFGSSPQKITHTGMYIGDGKFINATTHETPMVRIDNLNEPYWTKLLVAARRLKP